LREGENLFQSLCEKRGRQACYAMKSRKRARKKVIRNKEQIMEYFIDNI